MFLGFRGKLTHLAPETFENDNGISNIAIESYGILKLKRGNLNINGCPREKFDSCCNTLILKFYLNYGP